MKCIYCGCTETCACNIELPTGEVVGCSWISTVPPVCSNRDCMKKHSGEGLPTYAEQMASYDKSMLTYRSERDKYDRGERATLPPRPVRPHTPGFVSPPRQA